jgi:hypothetical protein
MENLVTIVNKSYFTSSFTVHLRGKNATHQRECKSEEPWDDEGVEGCGKGSYGGRRRSGSSFGSRLKPAGLDSKISSDTIWAVGIRTGQVGFESISPLGTGYT